MKTADTINNLVVSVGPDGTFKASGEFNSSPADIDHFFSGLQDRAKLSSPSKSITLYFHGGLVSESAGLAIAGKMHSHLQATETIPVFFIWETSIKETISFKLTEWANKPLIRKVIRIMVKYIAAQTGIVEGDGSARGVGGFSDLEIDQQLQRERPFDDCVFDQDTMTRGGGASNEAVWLSMGEMERETLVKAELSREVAREPDISSLWYEASLSDGNSIPAADANARGDIHLKLIKRLANIVMRIMKRFHNDTDHGFYPTIVEELFRELYIAKTGAWVWDGMKSKAGNMWKDNAGRTGDDLFAGSYLLESLVRYVQTFPQTKVNVIGHSAGTICICHMLAAARQRFPAFRLDTIIFLAPACRIDLFCEQIVRHAQLFVRFRCFTMTDENECKDLLIPYVYTRSLLYLVSGILEEEGKKAGVPILGLNHFLCRPANDEEEVSYIAETKKFLLENSRLVLSDTAADAIAGLRTLALKHGDFDDDLPTIESIKYMISQ